MTHFYRAYGLTLSSDIALSALREEHFKPPHPDVEVSFGPEPDWVRQAIRLPHRVDCLRAEADDSPFTLTSFGAGEFFELSYADGTHFLVDGAGKHMWGKWRPPLTFEDASTYLVGPVMGFVLRRRNILALHASSASVFGRSVILCGPSESGKSTTAAALALHGFPVLADDISTIQLVGGVAYSDPGYPRICLWPDAVARLFGSSEALPKITPSWEKRFLPLDGALASFESKRRPLGVVYLFAPRACEEDAPRIEESGMRDGLLQLVQNTYMNWVLYRDQRAAELDLLTKVVANVPVRLIVPHADPARLEVLCELLIKDAEGFSEPPCTPIDSGL